MPRVTVLLPSYMPDCAYMLECLAGLDAQTFRDFEVLLVDESKPEMHEFLKSQLTSFPLRVLKPPQRLGVAGSLNYGIANSASEFIARHDIDDICDPERLAKQVAYLDANPQTSAVGSWTMKIGASSEKLGVRQFPSDPRDVRRQSAFWNPFCHSAMMLRRGFFETYGVYGKFENEDYELWLRALARGAVMVNLPEPLVLYRIETHVAKPRPRHWRELYKLRRSYLGWDHLPLRLASLALTGMAALTPPRLFDYIYWTFNRLR